MPRIAFVAHFVICLAVAGPACASECKSHPLAEIEAEILAAKAGPFAQLTHEQLLFARGYYVALPPASGYPDGEAGEIAQFPSGESVVLFTAGSKSCGMLGLTAPTTKMLLEIDKSI